MDDNKLRFGVGVLVISSIGVGIMLTFLFGAFPSVLNDDYQLSVVFPSAAGINANSPVVRDGVKIGRVNDIQLLEEGGVLVSIALEADQKLTHRYIPQIGSGNFVTGDSNLEFVKASPQQLTSIFSDKPDLIDQPYTDQEFLDYGAKSESLFSMQGELSETLAAIRNAGESVSSAGESINQLSDDFRGVLGAAVEGNEGKVGNLADEAVETLEELQAAIRDVRAIVGDPDLKRSIDQSAEQLPELLGEAGETLRSTQRTLDRFGNVGERFDAVGEQFEEVGREANKAVGEIRMGVDEVRSGIDDARATVRTFRGTAEKADRLVDSADRTFDNLSKFTEPFAERGDQFADETLRTLQRFQRTLVEAERFAASLNNSNGTVKQLLDDDSLYLEIRRTVQNIELATARLRPILDDVRVFSDKIARDPRQLGIRGAINKRPNQMGLK